MRSATKNKSKPTKKTTEEKDAKPKKDVGAPIRVDQSYTAAQFEKSLDISRTTLHRWRVKHGLERFGVKVGGIWQIAGKAYFEWLESRRMPSAS